MGRPPRGGSRWPGHSRTCATPSSHTSVASTLTRAQWDAWEEQYYIKPKSKKQLGLEGHWLIDGGNQAVYDHVVGKVNPVLRLVLLRGFGPKYRKQCRTPVGCRRPGWSEPRSSIQPPSG
jgi:hypothetical protein